MTKYELEIPRTLYRHIFETRPQKIRKHRKERKIEKRHNQRQRKK